MQFIERVNMHRKDISDKTQALEKGISQLIDTLAEIDMSSPGQSSVVNDDGTETLLAFNAEKRGAETIGVYTLTVRRGDLNTTIQQERTLTE